MDKFTSSNFVQVVFFNAMMALWFTVWFMTDWLHDYY